MLSPLEYHILLALGSGPLHGYAISEAVAAESNGTLQPRAGSLYRIIARLMTAGLVREVSPPDGAAPHPGLARRYYALSAPGRRALAAEAQRLHATAALARERLRMAKGTS